MENNFADQVESKARLQFKLHVADTNLEEMIEKVKSSDVSDKVKQELFNWIDEARPNLMRAIALKEIYRK